MSFPRCFKYISSCILIKRFAFVSHSQASCSIITLCYKLIPDINSKFCTFVQSLSFSLAVNTVLLDKCSWSRRNVCIFIRAEQDLIRVHELIRTIWKLWRPIITSRLGKKWTPINAMNSLPGKQYFTGIFVH